MAHERGGLPSRWGVRPDDLTLEFPCEGLLDGPVRSLFRAVDVDASADLMYRWLCQIRVAPYSYDLIDNLGRRSPPELTPGAEELDVGTSMMVFRITSFEPGVHITGVTLPRAARLFGDVAVTYAIAPTSVATCRVVVRLDCAEGGGLLNRLRWWFLAWGDLIMMRKELLTLKAYAERDQRALVAV